MAQDLDRRTAVPTATVSSSSSYSAGLRAAIARISGSLDAPDRTPVSPAVAAEARQQIEAIDAAMQPAPRERVERWLGALGTLVAHQSASDGAAARIAAYAAMLEFPASAYTRSSLAAMARKCKFWPSYAELCEVLEAETADLKRQRHQLRRVLALPVAEPEAGARYSDLSDDQRAELDRLLAPFRRQRKPEVAEGSTPGPEI